MRFLPFTDKPAPYQRVSGSESPCSNDELPHINLPSATKGSHQRRQLFFISAFFASLALNGFLALFSIQQWQALHETSLPGDETELYEARKLIETSEVEFDGGFTFVKNMGGTKLHFKPGSKLYFGQPSPEIDSAWDEVFQGEYIWLNESEATGVKHSENAMVDGERRYSVVLDVMHQLHCLNEARKYIDMDYYADPNWSETFKKVNRLHLDHCLDYLRQIITCHSDLVPITIRWDEITMRPQPEFEKVHQCRNFDKIKDWAAAHRQQS
ncbi:unnamed protein product [Zymoseptoria tritici ST99CH_3D1]|nr:unnamed protein product [Zymoseptoria tritici ST99CH_3D1]